MSVSTAIENPSESELPLTLTRFLPAASFSTPRESVDTQTQPNAGFWTDGTMISDID